MKNLPLALLLEKNALNSSSPWLYLIALTLPDDSVIRIVNNTDEVTFQGDIYSPFLFELGERKESNSGEIGTLGLKISNVTRALQTYIDQYKGGIGLTVKITIVNADLLDEDYSELEAEYDILETNYDEQWVTFTLGMPNLLHSRFPEFHYNAGHCNWKFKSIECGFAGTATTCTGTVSACKAKKNYARFGGAPGMSNNGLRLV